MGRDASKAAGNPWYEARIRAAKSNIRLRSREGAAEVLGMSVSSVADAELGLSKVMPVDKAVLMAEVYNAPELLNWYCRHECPIGWGKPLAEEKQPLELATVKFLKETRLSELQQVKDALLGIAADGKISEDELPAMDRIVGYLDRIALSISELKVIWRCTASMQERRGKQ